MSKKVKLDINYNFKDAKLGYKGYTKTELKSYFKTVAKTARIYGDTRTANKYEKWANIKVNEAYKNKEGHKIRRMVNIASNVSQNTIKSYGKNAIGNTLVLEVKKPPRDSKKMKEFRETRKEVMKSFKSYKTLSPEHQAWVLKNATTFLEQLSPEEGQYTSVLMNILSKSGGFNSAYSKYHADMDRLISSSGMTTEDLLLVSAIEGNEDNTKIPNRISKK